MSALELPTYEAFSYYQFTDVLGALSLRLMVMDHTAKYKLCRTYLFSIISMYV